MRSGTASSSSRQRGRSELQREVAGRRGTRPSRPRARSRRSRTSPMTAAGAPTTSSGSTIARARATPGPRMPRLRPLVPVHDDRAVADLGPAPRGGRQRHRPARRRAPRPARRRSSGVESPRVGAGPPPSPGPARCPRRRRSRSPRRARAAHQRAAMDGAASPARPGDLAASHDLRRSASRRAGFEPRPRAGRGERVWPMTSAARGPNRGDLRHTAAGPAPNGWPRRERERERLEARGAADHRFSLQAGSVRSTSRAARSVARARRTARAAGVQAAIDGRRSRGTSTCGAGMRLDSAPSSTQAALASAMEAQSPPLTPAHQRGAERGGLDLLGQHDRDAQHVRLDLVDRARAAPGRRRPRRDSTRTPMPRAAGPRCRARCTRAPSKIGPDHVAAAVVAPQAEEDGARVRVPHRGPFAEQVRQEGEARRARRRVAASATMAAIGIGFAG